jgi:hypothetical protein
LKNRNPKPRPQRQAVPHGLPELSDLHLKISGQTVQLHPHRVDFFPPGITPVKLDQAVRTSILSSLQRCDRQAVEQFIERVEIILSWRRKFHSNTLFPATQLRTIHHTLTQTVTALEKVRPMTRDHLERAFHNYTECTMAPRMALEALKGYVAALNSYINLRSTKNPKGGPPPKATTVATIAAMADTYHAILGKRPSATAESPFANIILALLPHHLGEKTKDPRRLIRSALQQPLS